MNVSMNPFAGLIETKMHPNARSHRTSIWQKLWDTFTVFNGGLTDSKKLHVGIFDYATGFIPTLTLYSNRKIFDLPSDSIWLLVPFFSLVLINVALLIPRVVFSAILTLLASPVTVLVHVAFQLKGWGLKSDAMTLVGQRQQSESDSENSDETNNEKKYSPMTILDYLKERNMDIEELNIKKKVIYTSSYYSKKRETEEPQIQFLFWRKAPGLSGSITCEGCINGGCDSHKVPFKVIIDKSDQNQMKKIQTFYKLNLGGILSNQEHKENNEVFLPTLMPLPPQG